jgi:hypothetical protein
MGMAGETDDATLATQQSGMSDEKTSAMGAVPVFRDERGYRS